MASIADAEELAALCYGTNYELISRYIDLLTTTGVEWGLIGPREAPRIWDRHILNCAALAELVPHGSTVVDVGSGAGLPGIPLAVLRPDLRMTLLEPLQRRSTFLLQVVERLALPDRVTVVRARAEDHHFRYGVVTSRALAPLERLLRWCAPLRERTGAILALKGQTAAAEVDQVSATLRELGLIAEVVAARAHPDAEPASVVRATAAGR